MTLSELFNEIEINGEILVKVWDEETEVYTMDEAYFNELTESEQAPLRDLKVSHIYPARAYPDIVIELKAE